MEVIGLCLIVSISTLPADSMLLVNVLFRQKGNSERRMAKPSQPHDICHPGATGRTVKNGQTVGSHFSNQSAGLYRWMASAMQNKLFNVISIGVLTNKGLDAIHTMRQLSCSRTTDTSYSRGDAHRTACTCTMSVAVPQALCYDTANSTCCS